MSCCEGIAKTLLYIFNLIFCLSGIAIISVGVYVLVQFKEYKTFLEGQIFSAPIILIITGSIIFLVSFFGCCGVVQKSSCMLKTFAIFLIIIIILEVAVGVLAARYKGEAYEELEKVLKKTINSPNQSDKEAWDILQSKFKCCGVTSPLDWIIIPSSCSQQTEGCLTKLKDFVDDKATILIGIAFGLILIKLIGVIFSCCIASNMNQKNYF